MTFGKYTDDFIQKVQRQRAGLNLALGASTLQHIRSGMDQERKRVLAEDQIALGALGGNMPDAGAADMVGDVYLGDQHTNITSPGGQFGRMAGSALLASALLAPVAAVAWKYLDREPTPVIAPSEDTRRNIRIYRP